MFTSSSPSTPVSAATPDARGPDRSPRLTSTTAAVPDASADLEKLIRDGVAAGLSRRRLYRRVIDRQLDTAYPDLLSADDRRSAAATLLTDPQVRRLFDRLYRAA